MFRLLSLVAAAMAFVLAVLGSWVRINGAGMTCPDWPLCHGALVPDLRGGVVLEWSHRLVAFVLIVPVALALAAAWRERRRVAGIVPAIGAIATIFGVQVVLGAATVRLSNTPWSVALHWGTGMLFLAGLVALAILAVVRPSPKRVPAVRSALYPLLVLGAASAFAAMCAGAYVSSSGAGLACTSLPFCTNGTSSALNGLQVAQMTHRIFAALLFVVATFGVYLATTGAPVRVRNTVLVGYGLLLLQIALGIANVVWRLPVDLREAHAANAAATFVVYVAAWIFAAIDGTIRVPATERTQRTVYA